MVQCTILGTLTSGTHHMLKLTWVLASSLPSPQRPTHFGQPEVVHERLPTETVCLQMSTESEVRFISVKLDSSKEFIIPVLFLGWRWCQRLGGLFKVKCSVEGSL